MTLLSVTLPSSAAEYLPTIQQRWEASDLVCIGRASLPARTGQAKRIDGRNRDELTTQVVIETCLKGKLPAAAEIRVLGYSVMASQETTGGFIYAGSPPGFVSEGRNLLFLRRTEDPGSFEVTVPIYATAIHLADERLSGTSGEQGRSVRNILTRELEGALVQFGETDLTYLGYLFDYLGTQDGVAALKNMIPDVSLDLQRSIAVALLSHGETSVEPTVVALLLDTSAPDWKRQNAAGALGEHGTEAAIRPLQEVASQSGMGPGKEALSLKAVDSLNEVRSRRRSTESLMK